MIVAGCFLTGMCLWTLMEWLIHSGLAHRGRGRNPLARDHLRHHAKTDHFASVWKKIAVAIPVHAGVWILSRLLLSASSATALTAGFFAMYLVYEVVHRRCHTRPPTGRYGRWARRHHFYHHFHDPRTNHGLSTPLWDIVFRTHVPVRGPIRVPEKAILPWLIDPSTGDIRPRFAADYTRGRT